MGFFLRRIGLKAKSCWVGQFVWNWLEKGVKGVGSGGNWCDQLNVCHERVVVSRFSLNPLDFPKEPLFSHCVRMFLPLLFLQIQIALNIAFPAKTHFF